MRLSGIQINGIDISQEHYLLQKNGIQMRCDFNELNERIPEFEEYLTEAQKKLQTA